MKKYYILRMLDGRILYKKYGTIPIKPIEFDWMINPPYPERWMRRKRAMDELTELYRNGSLPNPQIVEVVRVYMPQY